MVRHRDRHDTVNYTAGDKQHSTETNNLFEVKSEGRSDENEESE